jgi:hypothetical protein
MQVLNKRSSSNGVYIGRPSKWGNPFAMRSESDRAEVIERFEKYLMSKPELVAAAKRELKGKNLVCWCAPRACHGDVLMRIANE